MFEKTERLCLDWTLINHIYPIENKLIEKRNYILETMKEKESKKYSLFNNPKYFKDIYHLSSQIHSHSHALIILGCQSDIYKTKMVYEIFSHFFKSNHPQNSFKIYWIDENSQNIELIFEEIQHLMPSLLFVPNPKSHEITIFAQIFYQYFNKRFSHEEALSRIFITQNFEHLAKKPLKLIDEGNIRGFELLILALCKIPLEHWVQGHIQAYEDTFSSKNKQLQTNILLTLASLFLIENNFQDFEHAFIDQSFSSFSSYLSYFLQNNSSLKTQKTNSSSLRKNKLLFFFQQSHPFQHTYSSSLIFPSTLDLWAPPCYARKTLREQIFLKEKAFIYTIQEEQIPTLHLTFPEFSPFWLGYFIEILHHLVSIFPQDHTQDTFHEYQKYLYGETYNQEKQQKIQDFEEKKNRFYASSITSE